MTIFRAVAMAHLQVQVPSRDGPAITREIAAHGLLHLIDIAHGTAPPAGGTDVRALLAKFRDLSRDIHRIAETLAVGLADIAGALPATSAAINFDDEYQDIVMRLDPVRSEVATAVRRLAHAREEKARLGVETERARRLGGAAVDAARIGALRFACVRLGAAAPPDFAALAAGIAPAPFAIVPLESSAPRPLAAIVVPTSGRERLDALLRVAAFEPIALPADVAVIDPASLQRQLDSAAADETAAVETVAALGSRFGQFLREIAVRAATSVLLLQAQTMFATAGRFLVISGWIPEDRAAELAAAIARVSGGRAVVTVDRPEALSAAYGTTLKVPILHRNPLLLRPFERLVGIYGLPSYGEVQPTAFFAVSFLLMFGLMFGDVGHGLVLVAAGYCIFRYMPRFLDYAVLLMEAGVASAVFGAVYGSVFGVETLFPAVIHPIRDLRQFVGVAIGLGVVLVTIGVVLNMVNSWRAGERLAALMSVRGLLGAFVYWTLMAVTARILLPVSWTLPNAAIFVLLGGAVTLLVGRPIIVRLLGVERTARTPEGATPRWLAALEASIDLVDAVFVYFANTISFVRIAAFAAVHAGVFVAIFALADTFSRLRLGSLISAGVLIAGNIAIIFLEGLAVTVQVLRLEYYEFFSRFFRGGGEPYRPLMLRHDNARGEP